MAMSDQERIARLLAPGGRFLSNKQTRDAGELTLIRQAKAVPPRTSTITGASTTLIFRYTGADQTFTVPTGVRSLEVAMWGAGGGGHTYFAGVYGGAGASLEGKLPVTAGETLTIVVGQGGTNASISAARRYGGGGAPGGNGGGSGLNISASGGGRSAIRRGTTDIATVGAGGGGRAAGVPGRGGIIEGTSAGVTTGLKGTQTAGGTNNGALYSGGDAIQDNSAGGGGGYYGGGGGSQDVGGGGGSSLFSNMTTYRGFESTDGYSAPNTSSRYYIAGVGAGATPSNVTGGNGLVVISWSLEETVSAEKFNTFEAQYLRKQYCAVCSMPDYSANGQIATDLSGGRLKGGYIAPWRPLSNTAKTTTAESCSACLQYYFPGQPPCCPNNPVYKTNYIDTFSYRYGGNKFGARLPAPPAFQPTPLTMLSTTGAFYTINVPSGASAMRVFMWGAAGTMGINPGGGNGAYVSGELPITGTMYRAIVGRGGQWDNPIAGLGGQQNYWGGGGQGVNGTYSGSEVGDGGGRSAIQMFSGGTWIDVVTAGGGGGGSGDGNTGARWVGGHATSSGTAYTGRNVTRSTARQSGNYANMVGGGGSQTQGGEGGLDIGGGAAAAGTQGFGGNGAGTNAGGGGGGYWGGGGGSGNGNEGGSGGGGSSYVSLLRNFFGIDGDGNLSSPTLYLPNRAVARSDNGYGGDGLVYYQFI